jgi:hypothetical protein
MNFGMVVTMAEILKGFSVGKFMTHKASTFSKFQPLSTNELQQVP